MVAPVAQPVPPRGSGSVELMTGLLTEGLVRRGHQVTLYAVGGSRTAGDLQPTFPRGYAEDPSMWPWELYEVLNLSAAVERAADVDLVHHQAVWFPLAPAFAGLCPVPLVQTLHHAPGATEVALWARYPKAQFVAISQEQARLLQGVSLVGVVPHGIDTDAFPFSPDADDYVLFLGRFTESKGVLAAIDLARRSGQRLVLAAPENEYYREHVASHVDGVRVQYAGEVDHAAKVSLLGGARALLYPVQSGEPFGLVLAEAMACGTPVAALDRGAVAELVDDGVTGRIFADLDAMADGLQDVFALDRARVRATAVSRFGVERMVDGYLDVYRRLLERR